MGINPIEPRETKDPGKTVADLAREQANKLIESISTKAIVELTDMRDHLDTLMRALKAREERIVEDIGNHASLAADVVEMKTVVRDSLAHLTERLTPAPKTITQRGNGHD